MYPPVVCGAAVASQVMLVGQAPGNREPILGRPFAWTAGRRLFQWFEKYCGLDEREFRAGIYMAAVCRCFPGKKSTGGDRVPTRQEIANCAGWLEAEVGILKPALVIPVGKLAIAKFLSSSVLVEVVGRRFRVTYAGHDMDLIPLPHPSGASPWPKTEPGKTLLGKAMTLIAGHPTIRVIGS